MPTVTAQGKTFNFPEGTSTQDIGDALDEYFEANPVQQPGRTTSAVSPQSSQQEYFDKTANEMSPLQSAAVGAGRAFVSLGQGVSQLAGKAGEALGFRTPEQNEEQRQRYALEEANYNELAKRRPWSTTAGNIVGSIAAAAPAMAIPGGQGLPARMAIGAGVTAAESMLQPVTGEDFAQGKLEQGATGAAIGAAIPGAVALANAEPLKNLMAGMIDRASKTPRGIEGARLNKELGGLMSIGQETGSKGITMLENLARQSIAPYRKNGDWTSAVDDIFQHDLRVAEAAQKRIDLFSRKFTNNPKSSLTLGMDIQSATKNIVDDLVQKRAEVAAKDYGHLRQLAGDQPIMQFDSVTDELNKIIGTYSGVSGADSVKVVNQAKKILKDVSNSGKAKTVVGIDGNLTSVTPNRNLTIDKALKNRSFWSQASKGKGNVFEDVSPSLNRQLGARLAAAAEKDFEELGNRVGRPELKSALDYANKNYKDLSRSIEAVEASALGKFVGDDIADNLVTSGFNKVAGERVAEKFLSLRPSEIQQSVRILKQSNPGLVNDIKAYVVQNALEQAKDVAPSVAASGVKMSFNKYIKALPDEKKLRAMGFSRAEIDESNQIVNALLRVGDRTGYNFSGTNVQAQAGQFASALSGIVTMSLQRTLGTIGHYIGVGAIAKAMTTPEGRQALMTIAKPSATRIQLERAAGILATHELTENEPTTTIPITRGR